MWKWRVDFSREDRWQKGTLPFEIKDKRPGAGEIFIYTCAANFLNLTPLSQCRLVRSSTLFEGGIGKDKKQYVLDSY